MNSGSDYYINCKECGGEGELELMIRPPDHTKLIPCEECNGEGYRLSEAGKDLVDFLEKIGVIK